MRNLYHARDPRKGRHSVAGQIYLVTTVTHLRQPLFEDLYSGLPGRAGIVLQRPGRQRQDPCLRGDARSPALADCACR